ncbi:hypothetical protein ACSBR2_013094 [Camellia fascicularis]
MATYSHRNKKTEMARRHIEAIKKCKFSVDENVLNLLTSDLHNVVSRLFSELYTKDVHFFIELI